MFVCLLFTFHSPFFHLFCVPHYRRVLYVWKWDDKLPFWSWKRAQCEGALKDPTLKFQSWSCVVMKSWNASEEDSTVFFCGTPVFPFKFVLQLSFLYSLSFMQWRLWPSLEFLSFFGWISLLLNARRKWIFYIPCYIAKQQNCLAWLLRMKWKSVRQASGKRDKSANINLMTFFISFFLFNAAPKASFDPFDTCFNEKWLCESRKY